MAAAFSVQRVTGSSGWIDTIWSAGVGLAGAVAAVLAEGADWRNFAVLALVIVWSLRLASHIGTRTSGGGEDPRYARLLEEWGEKASMRLFFSCRCRRWLPSSWFLRSTSLLQTQLHFRGSSISPRC